MARFDLRGLADRVFPSSRSGDRLAERATARRSAEVRTSAMRMHAARRLGFQLSTAPNENATIAGLQQQHRHPILALAEHRPGDGLAHQVQLAVYHALRVYLPTLDSAIHNRRQLEGTLVITSDDDSLAEMLTEWAEAVPVGYVDAGVDGGPLCGLADYVDTLASAADEYGLAAGEALLTDDARDIARLLVPCPRTLGLRRFPAAQGRQRDMRQLVQTDSRGQVVLDGQTIQTLAFVPDAEQPWPRPLAWSLVQAGEVLMRMYQSVVQGWWRFGDPTLLNTLSYRLGKDDPTPPLTSVGEGDAAVDVTTAIVSLKATLDAAMQARRMGYAADAYAEAFNAEIKSEVLGSVDATMMRFFSEHASTFDAYVVARSDTPAWMYPSLDRAADGLGGDLSKNQTILAGVAARKRNKKRAAVARQVLNLLLTIRGEARHIGRYDLEFDVVSIVDDMAYAELQSEQAEAASTVIANAEALFDENGAPRYTGDAADYLQQHGVL
ncbi:MAG: hypothetical protein AAGF99_05195 [Bacteroidota bacterium]